MINPIEHGNLLLQEGRFEEARLFAVEYLTENHKSDVDAITIYEMLSIHAFSYIRRSLANDAIPIVQEMLDLCSSMPDEEVQKRTFRCYNILGLLHFELTKLTEALSYLEQAYDIVIEINDKNLLNTITGNLGLIHSAMSNDVKALELLRYSESLSIELGKQEQLAVVCDNIATIFIKHGDYTKALEYYNRALELHQKNNAKDGIGRALGHIGTVHLSMKDNITAEKYLMEALAIHESIEYKRGIETWNEILGDIMLSRHEPDRALMHFSRAIEINQELGNRGTEAVHIGSMGDVHKYNGNLDDAFACYEQALQILTEYDRKGDYYDIQLEKAKILGNPLFKYHDIQQAEKLMLDSLDTLREYSLKSIEMNYLKELSELNKYQGNWEKAFIYYSDSILIKESLNSNEVRDTIKEMEFQKAYHQMEEKRSVELARLQEKEHLLHEILPSRIAEKIIQGENTIAEECQDMTIMFADIVGFTTISEKLSPSEVVKILNDVYSQLDIIADTHGIEKIKTIGDAYMAICNIGDDTQEHKKRMLCFAKDVLSICNSIVMSNGETLSVRIGIHSGPTVAGVIGTKKFSYDVWGDAVNTAARMESYGEPGTIQVSREFYESVKELSIVQSMTIRSEKEIVMKGKGLMNTVILN
jgi:class 3 adenylate cyclase